MLTIVNQDSEIITISYNIHFIVLYIIYNIEYTMFVCLYIIHFEVIPMYKTWLNRWRM